MMLLLLLQARPRRGRRVRRIDLPTDASIHEQPPMPNAAAILCHPRAVMTVSYPTQDLANFDPFAVDRAMAALGPSR